MTDRVLPVVGKTYVVNHTRKGTFTMEVTNVSGDAVDGVITAGRARLVSNFSIDFAPGDEIRISASLATFEEAP